MPVLGEVGEATVPPSCPSPHLHRCFSMPKLGWRVNLGLLTLIVYLFVKFDRALVRLDLKRDLWSMEEVARWTWTEERLQQVEGKVTLIGELLVPARKAWLDQRLTKLGVSPPRAPHAPAQTSAPASPATP